MGQRRTGSSRASDVFQGRAALREEEWSYSLMVRQVGFSDEGEYRCRLDFQASPTHNARVRLHVVGKSTTSVTIHICFSPLRELVQVRKQESERNLVCCVTLLVLGRFFIFILFVIYRFYTTSEIRVGIKIVQTLSINLLTSIDSS